MIEALATLWPFNETLWPLHWMRPWWLLALAPTLMAFFWQWRNHQQQSQWQRHIEPALLEHLLHNPVNARIERRRAWPLACAALTSCIAIVALAGPAWEKLPQTPQQQHNAMVVIADLTLSMHAQDVAPSRLTRMRYKLLELLAQRSEGQTALIAYSGDAHLVSPLTDDARTIAALVPALAPEIMPSIGSNAAAAFELAGSILASTPGPARIVWFTDEILPRDHASIREVVDQHRAKLVIIGIGTKTGGPVPLPSGKFLKDQQHNIVTAQLSANALQNLAAKVGGRYIELRTDNSDIDFALRDSLLDLSPGSSLDSAPGNELTAHGAASGQPGVLVFDAWLDRGATLCLLLVPVVLLAFRRGVVLACWCLLPLASLYTPELLAEPGLAEPETATPVETSGSALANLWLTPDQRAQQLLDQQRYADAAATFKREDWRGVAAFRGRQYEQALAAFSNDLAALESSNAPIDNDPETRQRVASSHYNLGHAQAFNGELQQAIEQYQSALELDPEFTAAAEAKALLEQLLRQREEQQGEQQQSEPQSGESDSAQQSEQQSGQPSQSDSDSQSQSQSESQQAQNQTGESAQDSRASRSADYSGSVDDSSGVDDASEIDAGEQAEADANARTAQAQAEQEQEQEQDSDTKAQPPGTAMASAEPGEGTANNPERARLQQWLNKIEDDPGGLLRRKFQYQRQLRERERSVIDNSKDGQLW